MNLLLSHYYGSSASSESDAVDKPFRPPRGTSDRHKSPASRQLFGRQSSRTSYSDEPPADEDIGGGGPRTREEREAWAQHLMRLEAAENQTPLAGDVAPPQDVHQRTGKWKRRVTLSTESLRQDLQQLRVRDCTFSPSINRGPRPTASRRAAANASAAADITLSDDSQTDEEAYPRRLTGDNTVFDRLYATRYDMQQKRREAEALRNARALQECSFRPRIVTADWTAAVQPRYLDPVCVTPHRTTTTLHGFGDCGLAQVTSADGAHRTEDNATFQPVTNKNVPPYVSEYLRQPVHERLHRSSSSSTRKNGHTVDASPPRPSVHRRPLTPAQRRDFEQRLAEDIAKRKASLETQQRLREQEQPSFRPAINRYAHLEKMTAEERAQLVERRQLKLKAEKQRLEQELHPVPQSFRASKESKMLLKDRADAATPLAVRYAEDVKRKAERLNALRREAEEAELKALRDKPAIHAPPPDSKRGHRSDLGQAIAGSLDDYRAFLKRLQSAQCHCREEASRSRTLEELELQECTFHPAVHDAPQYVKHIVAARSAARPCSRSASNGGDRESSAVAHHCA